MREVRLILKASPCDANLYGDGPETLAEIEERGRVICPHFKTCDQGGFLHQNHGHQCVMLLGLQLAQGALMGEMNVDAMAAAYQDDIPRPAKGFVYSADRREFTIIPREQALVQIVQFAKIVIGGSHGPQDSPRVTHDPPQVPKEHMRYQPRPRDPVEEFLGNLK